MKFEAITDKSGNLFAGIVIHLETAQNGTEGAKLCKTRIEAVGKRFPLLDDVRADLLARHACTFEGLAELAKAGALVASDMAALDMLIQGGKALERAVSPRLGASSLFLALQGKGAFAGVITNAIRRTVRDRLNLSASLEDSE